MSDEEFIKRLNIMIEEKEKEREIANSSYERLRDEAEQAQNEIIEISDTIEKWHGLIRAYLSKYEVSTEPIKLVNKDSYSEMLKDIAKQSNQILDVPVAIDTLLKANIDSDRKRIAHNVYNTLGRLPDFEKIGRGKYRYTIGISKNVSKPQRRTSKSRRRIKSGIKQAVKLLKEENPLMTLQEVTNRLINDGFDFKGKRPTQSVNMAWVALEHAKEGKQQKLLIPPTSNLTQEVLNRPRMIPDQQ